MIVKRIILHCADTRIDQEFTAADIDRWHKQRGWSGIGYHYVILQNGKIEKGRPENKNGAHCKGYNSTSLGVCFMGGKNEDGTMWDQPTDKQIEAYKALEADISSRYPGVTVHGHYEFSDKSCPNFNVCKLYEDVQQD